MRVARDFLTDETLTRRGLGATRAACADGSGRGCAAGDVEELPSEVMIGDPTPEILRGKGGAGGGGSPPHCSSGLMRDFLAGGGAARA